MINKTETFGTFSKACHFRQNLVLFFFQSHFDNTFSSVSFWPWGHSLFWGTNSILEHGWDVRGFTPAPPLGM